MRRYGLHVRVVVAAASLSGACLLLAGARPASALPARTSSLVFLCGANICEARGDGTRIRRLTRDGTSKRPYGSPSRAGGRLAFSSPSGDVYVVDRQGRHRRRVMPGGINRSSVRLDPSGRYVMVSRYISMAGAFLTCKLRLAGGRSPCTYGRHYWGWGPRLRLTSVAEPDGHDLRMYDFSETQIRDTGFTALPHRDNAFNGPAAVSPDGRLLAVTEYFADRRENGLVLFSAQTGRRSRVLTRGHSDLQPTWSPDGWQIAFVRYSAHGERVDGRSNGIWRIARTGGRATRVVLGGSSPYWAT
jgi:hypothetical protein